jgi:hypothetical protein
LSVKVEYKILFDILFFNLFKNRNFSREDLTNYLSDFDEEYKNYLLDLSENKKEAIEHLVILILK